jgi:hypothetical protein
VRTTLAASAVLLLSLFPTVWAKAQTHAETPIVEAVQGQKLVRIRSQSGIIAVYDPHILGDTLFGDVQAAEVLGERTLAPFSMPFKTVNEIIIRDGTHALEGLGIGALAGAALVAAVAQACQQDAQQSGDSCETAVPMGEIFALGIGSFGLLGLVAGAASQRWKTIYQRGTPLISDPYVGYNRQLGRFLLGFKMH